MKSMLVVVACSLVACSSADPPCSPGGEGLPPGEPVPEPAPGPSPAPPGPSGADPEAPHGYSRVNGEVCVCDARDAERLGCVAERPSDDPPNASCDPNVVAEGYNCGPAPAEQPDPQTPSICGEVFWCCYQIACRDPTTKTPKGGAELTDIPICPSDYKKPSTRQAAWDVWNPMVFQTFAYLQVQYEPAECTVPAANCHQHPIGNNADLCRVYPK